jgi:hypothetical protein
MNKIEKYLKDNFIDGAVVKNLGSWMLYQDGNTYPLAHTIDTAIEKLKKLFPEDQKEDREELKHCRNMIHEYMPKPNRFHKIGDEVDYGNWEEVRVEGIYDEGMIYKLSALHPKVRGKRLPGRCTIFRDWMGIYQINKDVHFYKKDRLPIHISNMTIGSLFYKAFGYGCDMNPDYQRGNVWDDKDKESLLDSIFNHIRIGTFCFNSKPFNENDTGCEIIDGKQRMTTLIDFRLDKFRYRSKLWSELHPRERSHIREYNIGIIELQEASKKEIYEYFLKLNTGGRAQDPNHINHVKELLKNERN